MPTRRQPYYIDLNAISARQSNEVGSLFAGNQSAVLCHYLDGGIIGPPPSNDSPDGYWKKPSLVISGDVELVPASFPRLAEVLNMKLVSGKIGAASMLKLSFAALTKGLTALSILSFSTAQREELLPELLQHLNEYAPAVGATAKKGVIGTAPKAYRWVDEMRAIGEAFDSKGHWDGIGTAVYDGFAEVYRTIAEETVLGEEKTGDRRRGTTVEDAAVVIASGR